MKRLFVAVWPPPQLLETLRALERPDSSGLRWTTEDQWHVTLRFLGGVGEEAMEPLARGLAGAVEGHTPVVARAGPRPRRLGRSVWALPVDGLEILAEAVAASTAGIGRAPDPRPFRGHLTLARAREPSALRRLPAPAVEASWGVESVTLVSSRLARDGARYEVVDSWAVVADRSPSGPG